MLLCLLLAPGHAVPRRPRCLVRWVGAHGAPMHACCKHVCGGCATVCSARTPLGASVKWLLLRLAFTEPGHALPAARSVALAALAGALHFPPCLPWHVCMAALRTPNPNRLHDRLGYHDWPRAIWPCRLLLLESIWARQSPLGSCTPERPLWLLPGVVTTVSRQAPDQFIGVVQLYLYVHACGKRNGAAQSGLACPGC